MSRKTQKTENLLPNAIRGLQEKLKRKNLLPEGCQGREKSRKSEIWALIAAGKPEKEKNCVQKLQERLKNLLTGLNATILRENAKISF